MNGLSERQKDVLRWLRDNPQSRARWLRKGKEAYGPPEKWEAIEIAGKQGSIIIAADDWKAIKGLTEIVGYEGNKIWQPNSAGLSALTCAQDKHE